jgi:alpha-galactosidase
MSLVSFIVYENRRPCRVQPSASGMPVRIEAPEAALLRLHLRWRATVPERWRVLNDHCEHSCGDLEWRGVVGERILPRYFMAVDGHGYSVAKGARASPVWLVDPRLYARC